MVSTRPDSERSTSEEEEEMRCSRMEATSDAAASTLRVSTSNLQLLGERRIAYARR